ncbi:UTRA domain-containing protein [Xanthomonas maliensis]|uniref:UTRA domain-containing protein n=1 Tax=Xanthomonas maliensis TaxID=1321368 RepID=UPI0003B6474D|nr:UTRA domain-containing protein [Xanthomonas maliensis]KAB7765494.1 GntR family transcriptional regulator [Xanthomonas maliensis]
MTLSRQHRITESIAAQIDTGEWGPDQRLPVERALAERFGCTRITLREALQQLEADGRIYRENRRGWFVSAPRVRYDPTSIAGFMQYVGAQGRRPRTELLSASRQAAGPDYAAALRLPSPEEEVFVLQRRRWIDRRAVLLETNVVRASWAPRLLEHDLAGSLSQVFNQKLGVFLSRSQLSMHPAGLDAAQALLLQSTTGTPCFRLRRISFAEDGSAVELDIESWRHDALEVVVRTQAPTRGAD